MKKSILFLLLSVLCTIAKAAWYGYQNNGISYELVNPDLLYVSGEFNGTPWIYKGNYTIPSTYKPAGKEFEVYGIRRSAFSGSPDVIKVTANSVSRIEAYAFSGCSRLKEVFINKVQRIDEGAFSYCSNLGHLELPATLSFIGDKAFKGCTGLRYISIPSAVKEVGNNIFEGCENLKVVRFEKNSEDVYRLVCNSLDPQNTVICYSGSSEKDVIQKYWAGELIYSNVYSPQNLKTYPDACYFEIAYEVYSDVSRMYVDNVRIEGIQAEVEDSVSTANPTLYIKKCTVKGLRPLTDYIVQYTESWDVGETHGGPFEKYYMVRTTDASFNVSTIKKTQTTCTIKISPADNSYEQPSKFAVGSDGDPFIETTHIITDLRPDSTYKEVVYADYNGKWMGSVHSFTTASMGLSIESDVHPTSISCKGSYNEGDVSVIRSWFDGYEDKDNLLLTGLEPEKEYTLRYNVELSNSQIVSTTKKITTPALELILQDPQPMTSTDTKVIANTNMSEMETNVGFQWRKYDAPESLKSSEGPAVIFENKVQGVIKRLQPTSFYNVRAFYKSAEGNYYYTDWITFDPSDFSYIEPVVYNSPEVATTDNEATIMCCFIEGSDGIVNQGIEYWTENQQNINSNIYHANSRPNVNVVYATGSKPTIVIENLNPGTTYYYHAFVTTNMGVVYGQEATFTTTGDPAPTGISFVSDDSYENGCMYIDLMGKKHTTPVKGVNIVVYKNGSSKKVVNK